MSDLGAIFHVKKDGVQYDAHAYTTLDECPEPNLKLTYKGQNAYVKLEIKGKGDVPCYVQPKSGSTVYQVKKEYVSVPTGSRHCEGDDITFTVPPGIRVLKIYISDYYGEGCYVGVTPGKTYTKLNGAVESWEEGNIMRAYVTRGDYPNYVFWAIFGEEGNEPMGISSCDFTIYWSPEINKMKPTYTDY